MSKQKKRPDRFVVGCNKTGYKIYSKSGQIFTGLFETYPLDKEQAKAEIKDCGVDAVVYELVPVKAKKARRK